MMTLQYGSELRGFSSMIRHGYEDIQLYIGAGNTVNDKRLIVSYEMHDISIQVTDQPACEEIVALWKAGKKDELYKFAEDVLFKALQADPSHILKMLKAQYERGVQDGRAEKAQEFRAVLMSD